MERPRTEQSHTRRRTRSILIASTLLATAAACANEPSPAQAPEQTTATAAPATTVEQTTIPRSPLEQRLSQALRGRPLWVLGDTVRLAPGITPQDVCAQLPGQQPFEDNRPGVTDDKATWTRAQALFTPASEAAKANAQSQVFGTVWVAGPNAQLTEQGFTGGASMAQFDAAPPELANAERVVGVRIGDGPNCPANAVGHLGSDGIPVIDAILPTEYAELTIADADKWGLL